MTKTTTSAYYGVWICILSCPRVWTRSLFSLSCLSWLQLHSKVYKANSFEYDTGMFVAHALARRSVWMSAGDLSTVLKVFAHLIGLSSGFFRDQGAGVLFGSIVVGTDGGWVWPSWCSRRALVVYLLVGHFRPAALFPQLANGLVWYERRACKGP